MQAYESRTTVFDVPALPEGARVTGTVTVEEPRAPRSLSDYVGAGTGLFRSKKEVDRFIAEERDSWPYQATCTAMRDT